MPGLDPAAARWLRRSAPGCHCGLDAQSMSLAVIAGLTRNPWLLVFVFVGRAGESVRGRAAARWLRRSASVLSHLLPNPLRRETPRPARKNSLRYAAVKQFSRARNGRTASRAGSRGHPPQAPVLYSRHSPPTHSFALLSRAIDE